MQQTDFNLNDLASSNMEVGNIGENSNDGTAMDSDDLVPSIDVSWSNTIVALLDTHVIFWLQEEETIMKHQS